MSLLPAYMSQLWKSYEQMHREDLERFDVNLFSVDPLDCHRSVLPFLALEVDVNIDGFSDTQARDVVQNAIRSSLYAGTLFSVKSIFECIGNIELTESFSTNPFYFKAKMLLDSDIPNINKYAYLIDKYKNARSQYELDFDLETLSAYAVNSGLSVNTEFEKGLEFEKEFSFSIGAQNNFRSGFDAVMEFDRESNYATASAATFDVATKKEYFDVNRFSDVKNQAIANMRLDFSYNESDVMHLPIPPIELKTVVSDMAVAVFDMNFSQNSSDVFHLNYEKNYEAILGVNIGYCGVIDMEFYDSGVNLNTATQTLTANAVQSVNLDI